MICISTRNGMTYLPRLIESLGDLDYLVIDTGSTDPEFISYLKTLKKVDFCNGGFCIGSYDHAVKYHPNDWYFFMHDSMIVKDKNFLEDFQKNDVTAWLSFPMFFDSSGQEAYVRATCGNKIPPKGIFGPIFYATREAMLKIKMPTPHSLDEAHGMERGLAVLFAEAGVPVHFIDEMDPTKFESYKHFSKFITGRP